MTVSIPVNLAVEDELSEAVLRTLLAQLSCGYWVGACYRRGGFGYLKAMIHGFDNAAKATPFLVLTDLDIHPCPPQLIDQWLPRKAHPNLIFRVAVREVESWVLGHREAFAKFAGIRPDLIPEDVDAIAEPKQFLIGLIGSSRKRELKRDIVPVKHSTARQGPNYNGRLARFVQERWECQEALKHSESLRRTVNRLKSFQPSWAQA